MMLLGMFSQAIAIHCQAQEREGPEALGRLKLKTLLIVVVSS